MKQGRNRIGLVIAGLLIPLLSGPTAYADDTELFVAAFDPVVTGAQPNILFIIDTSGSMDGEVVTQVAWDPNEEFDGCYEEDAIYWSTTGTVPGCGSNNYFWKNRNYCQASATDLAGVGQYQDGFKAWRGNQDRWVNLAGNRKNRRHDCAADQGIHGQSAGDGDPWIVDGDEGPWSDNDDDKISFGTTYTIYDSNWLNWNDTGGTVTTTRLQVVKDVSKQLIDNVTGVNVGLMRFNRNEYSGQSGGPVIHAMEDVNAARSVIKDTIDDLPHSGWTPLSETLYEAGQYYAGRAVDMGNNGPDVYSVPESRVGGAANGANYDAPVNFQCQKNYVILLTDGAPTRDKDANSEIQALPGFAQTVGSCDGTGHGACLDDMADYMFNYDLDPNLPGPQNVTTYTIGFTVDLPILASTAARGGGEYRLADDTASLAIALTQIVQSILDDATTFTAPSVPVNAFNRTRNLDDVFVSVFEPSNHVHWPGNLKKYKLQNGLLVGQDGQPAVDPQTGFFSDNAFSFWSDSVDGDVVGAGGAAHEQPAWIGRDVYTNIAGGMLNSAGNAVDRNNNSITAAMVGAPSAIERDNVLDWARGKDVWDVDEDDVTTDDRNQMGDPLHVRPVTVIYGGDPGLGTVEATIFISTNDGYMHAIDPSDGSERWSFIPSRLLGRLHDVYTDGIVPDKRYGLDGEITAYIANDDRQPGISGAEKVYIVFGMRRGGDAMFALDVTNPEAPELVWEIDSNTPGFEDMGQTWSRAHIDPIYIGGQKKHVVVVGGGYDEGQDNPGHQTDNAGNAVYMIDLETGNLLWSAGPSNASRSHDLVLDEMEYSIPAGMKVIDLTGDDVPDRMYVGDMGGQLWRFDILSGNAVGDLVEGGRIASLGAADLTAPVAQADVRRFYASPDVVLVLGEKPEWTYLSVNIGSGYRAHPLNSSINDEFFAVRDFAVYDVIDTDNYPEPLERDDLQDITNDTLPTMLPTDDGWRLRMVHSGEKILVESFTFDGQVFFTSFSPGSNNACTAGKGTNRLYRVRIEDGSPPPPDDNPWDPQEPPEPKERWKQLKQGGIAPDAVFFFPEDQEGDPVICIGAECMDPGFDEIVNRSYWFQDETQ
ncbi:MAG: PilC/PilY family type IV pilus protein [Gammaproteobacteria bacterium]|nr:PilC/PilY family type IV pilus protein [Gammaproteobacteria bacterium]